jgi:hypothetical protein
MWTTALEAAREAVRRLGTTTATNGQAVDALTVPTTGARGEVSERSDIRVGHTPTLRERDAALPAGLKASYCPTCSGRTVVVTPAADNLACARCTPAWQRTPRRIHNHQEDTR